MCLSVPSQVIELHEQEHKVTIDTLGVQRKVSCLLLDDLPKVGDYVLIHIGFVMNTIDEAAALESLAAYKEMVEHLQQHPDA